MTDANGTRNNRPGSQGPTSQSASQNGSQQSPNQSHSRPFSSSGGTFIERPKLNVPASRFLPRPAGGKPPNGARSEMPSQAAKGQVNNGQAAGSQANSKREPGSSKVGEKIRTRQRAGEDRPTRRSRRSRNSNTERRRLFGTVPDRIKSKSSSRTRALKARTGSPADKKSSRTLKKAVGSLASTSTASSISKGRPSLPNPTYPGRVPPVSSPVRKRRRSNNKYVPMLRRGVQLLIVGIGIAVIGGVLLKVLPGDPVETATPETVAPEPKPPARTFPLPLTQEVPALKASLQELPNFYPNLIPKIFYADVDTGQYVSIEGAETIAAASTIKLPILLAFFEEVDAGRIDPNQKMAIQQPQIAEGSGDMQLSPPGTQFTALEVASQMIINSDNTATNMMIDLLGGKDVLNSRFLAQGLEKTKINTPLPDLEGTNTTSARDLVHTMLLIAQGEDLELRSRDRVLNILNRTYNKSLLANGPIEEGALTYNKTGDIRSVLGDVAMVDLPNGKRYVVAALVERPDNDGRAQELIRRISGETYKEAAKAIQPAVTPLGNSNNVPEGETVDTPGANTSGADSGEPVPAGNALPDGAAQPSPGEAVAPIEDPPIEEEPYPSANPRD